MGKGVDTAGKVQELNRSKGLICREILTSLPEWFGRPEAIDQYAAQAEHLPMFGFVTDDATTVAFLSVKTHFATAAEAYVLGVRRDFHRRGIGRRLFMHVERKLQEQGIAYLTVKTISASMPNRPYAMTREFYDAVGFVPLEEFPELWGGDIPCLLMVKQLISIR